VLQGRLQGSIQADIWHMTAVLPNPRAEPVCPCLYCCCISLTPPPPPDRQRIASYKEIKRLRGLTSRTPAEDDRLKTFETRWVWGGCVFFEGGGQFAVCGIVCVDQLHLSRVVCNRDSPGSNEVWAP